MKIAIAIGLSIVLFSCKKGGLNAPPNITPASYVASMKQYATQITRIDSIYYDTSHNITELVHYDYDTSGGSPVVDTIHIVFTYVNDSTPPVSYTAVGITHKLTYDGQNRIIKDSLEDGSGNNSTYTYATNSLVLTLEKFIPSHNIWVDSLFLLSNGNISVVKIFNASASGVGTLSETYTYTAYAYLNPTYHPKITNTIGPLLHFITYDYYYQTTLADMISNQMGTRASGSGSTLNGNVTSVITTDAQGRVVQSSPYYGGVIPINGKIVYTYY